MPPIVKADGGAPVLSPLADLPDLEALRRQWLEWAAEPMKGVAALRQGMTWDHFQSLSAALGLSPAVAAGVIAEQPCRIRGAGTPQQTLGRVLDVSDRLLSPAQVAVACSTNWAASGMVMKNRAMSSWVTVTGPPRSICDLKIGTTDPAEPSTVPKRTAENRVPAPVC